MDKLDLMMEIELLQRSLYNSYHIANMKLERMLKELAAEVEAEKKAKEEEANG